MSTAGTIEDVLTDHEIAETLARSHGLFRKGSGVDAAELAIQTWMRLREAGGAARLATHAPRVADVLVDAVFDIHEFSFDLKSSVEGVLREAGALLLQDSERTRSIHSAVGQLVWAQGRRDEALDALLAEAASTGDPMLLREAGGIVLAGPDATVDQLSRVREALAAAMCRVFDDPMKEFSYGEVLDSLDDEIDRRR